MHPLRAWRAGKLMSVKDLAEAAGVEPKTITDLEYGRRRPDDGMMRRIADALGVDPLEVSEFADSLASRCEPSSSDDDH